MSFNRKKKKENNGGYPPFLNMWKFGNLEIEGKVVLGPMAGFTSMGYRKFYKKFGVDLSYSEMVSDMGLIYQNQETLSYLNTSKDEGPVGIQLFGSEPENIKKAAEIVAKTCSFFDFFDINAGCPVPKVIKSGAGSSLLKEPKKLADMVRAIKSVSDKPVSVKIRLGWDNSSINFKEVIKELEEAGVDMIAIHARTKKELYLGKPHFDLLKDLRKEMRVPLVVSGNIYTLDDAIEALDITGADAIMVARGGLGNPWLIKQLSHYFKAGERLPDASLEDQKKYCLELAQSMIEEKGEITAMRIYRSIAPKFFFGFPNSKEVRSRLAQSINTFEDLKTIVESI